MKEVTVGSTIYYIRHQLQKVAILISWNLWDFKNKKSKCFKKNHFSQWSSSLQNSWKMIAIGESFQLLKVTS
jgi:hypothetical protein